MNIASEKGWEVRSGIGDAALRNAFAHRGFEVVGDEVSLSPQRRRSSAGSTVTMASNAMSDRIASAIWSRSIS